MLFPGLAKLTLKTLANHLFQKLEKIFSISFHMQPAFLNFGYRYFLIILFAIKNQPESVFHHIL